MAKKLVLSESEISVLQKIAKVSHMDNWFNLDNNGVLRDRENNNRVMSVRNGCKQLMEGVTSYDLSQLNGNEVFHLLDLVGNGLKKF
jgi:hypothetical protein